MGHKVFVSYKYADDRVKSLPSGNGHTTVRAYVDELENMLGRENLYKGEHDGEDLSGLSDDVIKSKLADRLYDSAVTIVLVSPGMKECFSTESEQWIPWEVAYSLKTECRHSPDGTQLHSYPNGVVAVVLPDESGSYGYCIEERNCCSTGCQLIKVKETFPIISRNIFNKKEASKTTCSAGSTIWHGESGYIEIVTWESFKGDCQTYIDRAYDRKDRRDEFEMHTDLES